MAAVSQGSGEGGDVEGGGDDDGGGDRGGGLASGSEGGSGDGGGRKREWPPASPLTADPERISLAQHATHPNAAGKAARTSNLPQGENTFTRSRADARAGTGRGLQPAAMVAPAAGWFTAATWHGHDPLPRPAWPSGAGAPWGQPRLVVAAGLRGPRGLFRGPACLHEPRSRRRSSWPILAAKTHITQEKPHKHLRSGQCSCFLLSHVRLPVWPSQQLQAACKAASAWLMMRGSLATLLPTYWLQALSSPPCQQHPASCSSPIVQDRAGSVHTQVGPGCVVKLKKSVFDTMANSRNEWAGKKK